MGGGQHHPQSPQKKEMEAQQREKSHHQKTGGEALEKMGETRRGEVEKMEGEE